MNKCKAIGLLNDARKNATNAYGYSNNPETRALVEALDNPAAFAMDILRHEMKDKSEGELYHAWMCNIKFAVYDNITSKIAYDHPVTQAINEGCEGGAKIFLDRLLKDEQMD